MENGLNHLEKVRTWGQGPDPTSLHIHIPLPLRTSSNSASLRKPSLILPTLHFPPDSRSIAPEPLLTLSPAGSRSSARGKGHEEGGSAYAKPQESPWKFLSIYPQNQSLPIFCFVLSPTPLTLRGAVPHYLSLKKELTYSSS